MSMPPQPLPPPLPVQPISYGTPVSNRPGLITAIGVISIVVGSLALLFNGISGFWSFGMMMISSATQTAVARQAAAKQATATVTTPGPVDPVSMPKPDRQTVLKGLSMHRPISPARREQLDALLVKFGRQIFKLQGADLTVNVVQQNVTDSGRLPDAKGGEGPDFFAIGEGRIELADTYAKFVPGDGRETVRVSASEEGEQQNWQAGLTPAQVKAIIDKIEQQAGQPLTAGQKSKLDVVLSSPAQGFFTTAATIPAVTSQLQRAVIYNSGANGAQMMMTTGQGMLTLDAQGNTVTSTTWGAGAFGPGGAGPVFKINMPAAIVSMTCAALSALLAIYLLVIGIFMLRQHPRAGRLHKIYAWIKIPVAIAGGIALVITWTSFIASAAAAGPGGAATAKGMATAGIAFAIVAVVLGCLYPVSLLIALRSRSMREYYASVQ
jgi:hypothetical protein